MQFTIGLPTDHVDRADEFVTGEAVTACARAAEAAGFDVCFVTDHPAPDAKWLAGGGHHALDPFVALSFAAAATDPAAIADPHPRTSLPQSAADGEVGLEPRCAVGRTRDPRRRARIPEARVRGARRRLRRAQRADRRSNRRDAPGVDRRRDRDGGPALPHPGTVMRPRSPQVPHPPIWVGGNSTAAMRRAAERGQGWVPFPNPGGAHLAGSHPRAVDPRRTGPPRRDPARARRRRSGAPSRSTSASRRSPTIRPTIVDELHTLAALGVTWAVLHLPSVTTRGAWIDEVQRLADAVIGPYRAQAGRSS